ncbi:MAG: hypothetical protein JSW07_04450 [bacterium]|nr:MAG: hypothetical protein JSW07_04450 [bacterium]
MYEKIRVFIDKHIERISGIFVIILIASWILSQFIPKLKAWMIEQNLLIVVIAILLIDVINRLVNIAKREGTVVSMRREEERIFDVIASARDELLIMGGNIFIITYHAHRLAQLFEHIKQVRILILDGNCNAARLREQSIIDDKNYLQLHEGTLKSLGDIARELGASAYKMNLRVYDLPAMHFFCIADGRRMVLNNYSYGRIGVHSPHFYFDYCDSDPKQHSIMKHYKDAFEFVWEKSKPKEIQKKRE